MQIYPAVDIKNGKCVRLKQGNFDAVTVYEQNPVIAAKKWIEKGATYLHIVDLDGAKEGISENEQIIAEIAKLSDVPVQTGGGVRSLKDIERKLQKGVFAKDVIAGEDAKEEEEELKKESISNEVTLIGYICKKPIYRQTPFKREIADILLAVNRAYNKSDYIPCIAWGRNARFCQNIEVGTCVKIVGRVQSRVYEKKLEDGTVQERVAYEVSVGSMEIIDEDNKENNVLEENKEAI